MKWAIICVLIAAVAVPQFIGLIVTIQQIRELSRAEKAKEK